MVLTWGGSGSEPSENGVSTDQVSQHLSLPGFDDFIMTTFSPLCWAVPSNPNFDPKDAQGKQVLGEAAALQKAIYTKTGEKYLSYLRDIELRGMGMDGVTIDKYLGVLCNAETKAFQAFFRVDMRLQASPSSNTDHGTGSCAKKHQMIGHLGMGCDGGNCIAGVW